MIELDDNEVLKILTEYALELVRIRQSNVPHLCTENIGPEVLRGVIEAYENRGMRDFWISIEEPGETLVAWSVPPINVKGELIKVREIMRIQ